MNIYRAKITKKKKKKTGMKLDIRTSCKFRSFLTIKSLNRTKWQLNFVTYKKKGIFRVCLLRKGLFK